MRPGTFKTETKTRKNGLKTESQDFTANHPKKICQIKTVVKFTDLQSCYLFVVRQFFMVAFMLDMHGTSNSTAVKFFPTSTACSIQGK